MGTRGTRCHGDTVPATLTCSTESAPFLPYPEHSTISRSGSGLFWNWGTRGHRGDVTPCPVTPCHPPRVPPPRVTHPVPHLLGEEGRLAHGGVGAGADVEDAVTNLRGTWTGDKDRVGDKVGDRVGDTAWPRGRTSKE